MKKIILASLLVTAIIAACTHAPEVPIGLDPEGPTRAAWDGKVFADQYTALTIKAIEDLGGEMMKAGPKDESGYCPKFDSLTNTQKKQFYVMLISTMSLYESSFNTDETYEEDFDDVSGKKVISRGLLQISQESANQSAYGCHITDAGQLHDPETNIRCAVKILNYWIPKDNYFGSSPGGLHRGGARYWSVLRENSSKRAKIQSQVKTLSFCTS